MTEIFWFLSGLLQSLLILFNNTTTWWDQSLNKSSISDSWIEQTDDQALDRSRVIYTENKRAQWLRFVIFIWSSAVSFLFNNVTTWQDWSLNKSLIFNFWIEQTDDQALDESRIIYTENKRAQWLKFCCFYLTFCSLFFIQWCDYVVRSIFQQIFNFQPLNWTNKWSSSRQIYTSRSYIYRE